LKVKPVTQISFGFVIVTIGVLLVANSLGLIPNETNIRLQARVQLVENLAVQFSVAAEKNNFESISEVIRSIVERNGDVISGVLRKSDKSIVSINGHHSKKSGEISSIAEFLRIPIFKNGDEWGDVELRFVPLLPKGVLSYFYMSIVQLLLFVSICGFFVYLFLIRKILHHLDPSKIIPERVQTAMNALSEGVVLIGKDEKIVFSNDVFAERINRTIQGLMGVKLSKLFWNLVNDDGDSKLPWEQVLVDESVHTHVAVELVLPDRNNRAFIVNSVPIKDNNGKMRGVLVSFNDVTELEQKNIELEQKRKAEKSRIKWLESMAVFLRHELRTPLIGASTSMMLLEESHELGADDKQLVERTKKSHDVIKKLLDSITEATNVESTFLKEKTEPVRIDSLIEELVKNYNSIYSDQNLVFESDGSEIIVKGQEERFIQMLDKLVNNAVDYCKEGSPIVVSCNKIKQYVVIKVVNEGAALPDDKFILFDLFSSFRNEETVSSNRGIGLYVVKLIVEGYGGSVEAKDRDGVQGAEFIIKLPVV